MRQYSKPFYSSYYYYYISAIPFSFRATYFYFGPTLGFQVNDNKNSSADLLGLSTPPASNTGVLVDVLGDLYNSTPAPAAQTTYNPKK